VLGYNQRQQFPKGDHQECKGNRGNQIKLRKTTKSKSLGNSVDPVINPHLGTLAPL